MNKKELIKINEIYQKTRDFFNQDNFLEIRTPIMTKTPGMEPHLSPFETILKTPSQKKHKVYLNHSPELQMKKVLGMGFEKIYNITKVFRNGEIGGGRHNTEFTMLEWYRQNANYKDLMNDCEQLILVCHATTTKHNPPHTPPPVATQHSSTTPNIVSPLPVVIPAKAGISLTYQSHKIDLSPPWPRISIHKLFLKYTNIDLLKNKDFKTFKKTAKNKGISTSACQDWDDIFFKIFLNKIERKLGFDKPIFIYDYPSSQAALAKKKKSNPFWAERFELYIAGIELTNGFSELIDSKEQKERLKKEQKLRKKLKKTVFEIDNEFLELLDQIKSPSAGIALGLDRLIMLLLNKKTIEEVLLFPMSKYIN